MSRETRARKRQRARRRRSILFLVLLVIAVLILIGYYRSNESQILTQVDYVNSEGADIFLLKDTKYIVLDNFSSSNLSYPEGTKASGYDVLTTTPLALNQDFVNQRITALQTLINNSEFNNWDAYSQKMIESLAQGTFLSASNLDFYKQTACYAPKSAAKLQEKLNIFTDLNTGTPIDITLTTFGIQDTGFIYSGISEYDQLANEAILGDISEPTLDILNHLDTNTNTTNALKIINSDHFFAVTALNKDVLIQNEEEVKELKRKYSNGLNNSQYYNMLITRVDRLRDFPELAFEYQGQTFPFYVIDVKEENNKKILVLIIKDYLSNLATSNKIKADLNTQDLKAYVIPDSALIKKDDKTYIQLLEKGYFTNEVEVKVTSYDKQGNAVLSVNDNPDLNSGTSIKVHP